MGRLRFLVIFAFVFLLIAEGLYATEYTAFSLKIAQKRAVSTPKGKDFREIHPKVFTLGDITKIKGLLYDTENEDIILVGERNPQRATLTLDDLVVALRARFVYGEWPLVSIDPIGNIQGADRQRVRFAGGIQNTQYGQDLFEADYKLKQIGMGLIPLGLPGVRVYWDLIIEQMRTEGECGISSRFWFKPLKPPVVSLENVVAIREVKVTIFTEVLYAEFDGKPVKDLTSFHDAAGDKFAACVTEHFEELARAYPSFTRVRGLDELVALTHALELMERPPQFTWWLEEYPVKEVGTERDIPVLRRKDDYWVGARQGWLEIAGGVELRAIALRLKAGDVTALQEAVLTTRPRPNSLCWTFSVEDWGIVGPFSKEDMDNVAELYAHGEFLFRQRRYDLAIAYWRRILQIMPEMGEIYYRIGQAFERKGLLSAAADYYSKALALEPFLKNLQESHTLQPNVNQ